MQTRNPMLDDLARLFSGAMGVAAGMRGEVEAQFRQQFERLLAQMDLVPREDFEVVRAMAAKARDEQESLAERVAALEKQVAAQQKAGAKPATRRTTRKSPAGGGRSKARGGADGGGASGPSGA